MIKRLISWRLAKSKRIQDTFSITRYALFLPQLCWQGVKLRVTVDGPPQRNHGSPHRTPYSHSSRSLTVSGLEHRDPTRASTISKAYLSCGQHGLARTHCQCRLGNWNWNSISFRMLTLDWVLHVATVAGGEALLFWIFQKQSWEGIDVDLVW